MVKKGKTIEKQVHAKSTKENTAIPELPNLHRPLDINKYRGPTEYCNWVIPNILLVGGFPRRSSNITDIIESGPDVFVCLVEQFELQRINGNYEAVLKSKSSGIELIHFPIKGRGTAPDKDIIELIGKLSNYIINEGRRVFVHCVGGHGRGGTVISLLLAKIYVHLDSFKALSYCQIFHKARLKGGERESPQSSEQRNQVHRIVAQWRL